MNYWCIIKYLFSGVFMDGPTIGKDKYYHSDIEELLVKPYSESDDLSLLKHMIYKTSKGFLISENYLYLLERLGFTRYVPISDGVTLDLGKTSAFLFPYRLGISFDFEYTNYGKKGVSLCFSLFPFKFDNGPKFYYLRVKSFYNEKNEFFRKSKPFMIVYDNDGDEFTFFKKLITGELEQKTVRPYTSLPIQKEYYTDKKFYLSYVQMNHKNEVTYIEYRLDGLRFLYSQLCDYYPHYKEVGIDKLGKRIVSVTDEEAEVIRMIRY